MNLPRIRLEEGATQTAGTTETKASSDTPKETVATVQETPEGQVPTIKGGNRGEQGHTKRDRGKPSPSASRRQKGKEEPTPTPRRRTQPEQRPA